MDILHYQTLPYRNNQMSSFDNILALVSTVNLWQRGQILVMEQNWIFWEKYPKIYQRYERGSL